MDQQLSFAYTRVYSDENGESRFEDVNVPAQADGDIFVAEPIPLEAMIMRGLMGQPEPFWHPAPRRQFIVYLDAALEVETSDGERRRFGTGDVVLYEDLEGRGHIARWLGEGPRRMLFLPAPQ